MAKSFLSKYKAVIFLGIILFLAFIENYLQEPFRFENVAPHQVVDLKGVSEVWVREAVYIGDAHLMLAAGRGLVNFLGGIGVEDKSSITTLDAFTGDIKWQIDYGSPDAIVATSSGFYIGQGGGVKIVKYDPFDRVYEWYTGLPGTRGLANLAVVSDEVYVQTGGSSDKLFVLDADTGEIIQQLKGYANFISIDGVTYQGVITSHSHELEAVDINSQELLWNVKMSKPFDVSPMFTKHEIFALTYDGGIYCVERERGVVRWYTEINTISNLVLARNVIYFISRNGQLQGVDIRTGETTDFVQFDTERFILNGEAFLGGYYVAYDDQTRMLFVQLGDSAQLFAFQLNDKE